MNGKYAGCSHRLASVDTAYRLSQAERLASENKFDITILDINVDRGQTGLALGHDIAENGAEVIFASGNGCDAAGLRAEGFAFIDKPFFQTICQKRWMLCYESGVI